MKNGKALLVLLFLASCTLLGAPPADAVEIHESEEVRIEIRALFEAGWGLASEQSSRVSGPRVGMARLSARAEYFELGRVLVQYEAAPENARLLDALGVLYIFDGLELRLGYFKTPISQDFNISASRKPFPSRAQTADLTPRRKRGSELRYTRSLDTNQLRIGVGLFDLGPLTAVSTNLLGLTVHGEFELPPGLTFHASYLENFFQPQSPMEPSDELPFYLTQPRLFDLGARYGDENFYAHLEVVFAPVDTLVPTALYAAFGLRLGDYDQEPTLEPIVGYDLRRELNSELSHRVRAGINAYLLDNRFVPNLHYEAQFQSSAPVGHAVFALLRIGI